MLATDTTLSLTLSIMVINRFLQVHSENLCSQLAYGVTKTHISPKI